MDEAIFPIMSVSYDYEKKIRAAREQGVLMLFIGLPWPMLAPHEAQAQRNHSQSLKRLAERGGLSACEAVAVLEDRRWQGMTAAAANARLLDLLTEYRASRSRQEGS